MISQPNPMRRRDIKHMPRPTVHLTSHLLKPLSLGNVRTQGHNVNRPKCMSDKEEREYSYM